MTTKLQREMREKRKKRIEAIGYDICPPPPEYPLSTWTLRQPTGRMIQHYVYEATTITGAKNLTI